MNKRFFDDTTTLLGRSLRHIRTRRSSDAMSPVGRRPHRARPAGQFVAAASAVDEYGGIAKTRGASGRDVDRGGLMAPRAPGRCERQDEYAAYLAVDHFGGLALLHNDDNSAGGEVDYLIVEDEDVVGALEIGRNTSHSRRPRDMS